MRFFVLSLVLSAMFASTQANAQDELRAFKRGPNYTADGKVIRPEGWRKWIYVGTPVTPDDMNGGEANFREFHNTYIDPDSFAVYHATGVFPNGTQIVKEMVKVGTKEASSGNGYFMGDYFGLELAVKDTVRFKDEPGGWVYFSFGHHAPPYAETAEVEDSANCNSCHEASADDDWVFTQYYPVLREAKPKHMAAAAEQERAEKKGVDEEAMNSALASMGAGKAKEGATADDYANKMFAWLQTKSYASWKSESAVHRSKAGSSHGDVKIFYNEKLNTSTEAGNKTHPIGSVSVKELYKDGGHIGWALAFKAREDDGKGHGWYWYENTSLTDGSTPIAASFGNSKCVGCHKPGKDFIRAGVLK